MRHMPMKSIPSINKFRSREEWEQHIWKKIEEKLSGADSTGEVGDILNLLLTAHEKRQIIKRVSAISLLGQGKSYGEIGELLWLSPQTISAIRKSMRSGAGYVSGYGKHKKLERNKKKFSKEELDQLEFSWRVRAFFTLPPPPLRHPRLMRQLGYPDWQPRIRR